jgi:peptidoglycan DL-endopeptidase LytF
VIRWAAPAAFLAGLTIAVLLIRAGLHHTGLTTPTGATPIVTRTVSTTPPPASGPAKTTTATGAATTASSSYTVQSGDTYGSIAAKFSTSVQQLEQLNPGISSNSLSVGQKIRVK